MTTDIKPEMLSGVQTRNGTPHDKYNIRGIAHVRTNGKDDIFMQRHLMQSFKYILEWGRGTCILTKHTRRWTYSPLRHFFPLRSWEVEVRSSMENSINFLLPLPLEYFKAAEKEVSEKFHGGLRKFQEW